MRMIPLQLLFNISLLQNLGNLLFQVKQILIFGMALLKHIRI